LRSAGAGASSPLRFGAGERWALPAVSVGRLIGAATTPPLPRRASPRIAPPQQPPPRGGATRARRPAPAAAAGWRRRTRDATRRAPLRAPAACSGGSPSPACSRRAGERRAARARGRMAQRGGGGAVGAPMRRRARRPIEPPRLGGAESKRRRRPRLPAPPSRVTLLTNAAPWAAGTPRLCPRRTSLDACTAALAASVPPPARPLLGPGRSRRRGRVVRPPVGPAVLAVLARGVMQRVREHRVLGVLPGQLEADEPLDRLQTVDVLLACA